MENIVHFLGYALILCIILFVLSVLFEKRYGFYYGECSSVFIMLTIAFFLGFMVVGVLGLQSERRQKVTNEYLSGEWLSVCNVISDAPGAMKIECLKEFIDKKAKDQPKLSPEGVKILLLQMDEYDDQAVELIRPYVTGFLPETKQ